MRNSIKTIPISPHDFNCDGYGNPGAVGNGYIMGFVMGVGKVKVSTEPNAVGSQKLNHINAFDRAEVEDAYLGQINMINVSSFCGPMGFIWGYDLVPHDKLYTQHPGGPYEMESDGSKVSLFSLDPLLESTKALFGTVTDKRFPLLPGSHVPCAAKHISDVGPGYLYCSLSIGIPKDRTLNACLLMEDIGHVERDDDNIRTALIARSAKSILEIGKNQHVEYKEIFTGLKIIGINKDEIGCALIAAPYFSLAHKAFPDDPKMTLFGMSQKEWEDQVLKTKKIK